MGYFDRRSPGGKTAALLSGLGLGAALMYVLDPQRGRRRRAMVRDKAISLANKTSRAVARTSRDWNNRAKGLAAEVRSAVGGRPEESGGGDGNGKDRVAATTEAPERPMPPERPAEDRGTL